MIGATPLIKARKNGNVQRVIELHAKGMSAGRIATKLGVERKTVQSYLKIYAHTDSLDSSDDGPHCRCGLRLPCACGGRGLQVEDFARSGMSASGT